MDDRYVPSKLETDRLVPERYIALSWFWGDNRGSGRLIREKELKQTWHIKRVQRRDLIFCCAGHTLEAGFSSILLLASVAVTQYDPTRSSSGETSQYPHTDSHLASLPLLRALAIWLHTLAQHIETLVNIVLPTSTDIFTNPTALSFTIASFVYSICISSLHHFHLLRRTGHSITRVIYIVGTLVALVCFWCEVAGVKGLFGIGEMLLLGVAVAVVGDWACCMLGDAAEALRTRRQNRQRRWVADDDEKIDVV